MSHLAYVPCPPLSDHVALLWGCDAYGGTHPYERVLPTGTCELVVTLADGHAVICGAHSAPFIIDTRAPRALLGVHFKPGGAAAFLGVPAEELGNVMLTADALWGRLATELTERVAEPRTWPARFRALEAFLLERLRGRAGRHPAVAFALRAILAAPHTQAIGRLTEHIGLSSRRFIEVFAGEVGLTPKVFCRVQRFQRALTHIDEAPHPDIDWTTIALDCGYYDQAHFIHDFRAFSGVSPTAYLRVRGPHRNHLRLSG
jgi:AraC-like DNA-binding protein